MRIAEKNGCYKNLQKGNNQITGRKCGYGNIYEEKRKILFQ